jgi:bifunctional UDP-N-acetylglucosamine pyrophosphorylase/glucosamine-1-phosphate N-acetyltransferase
MKLCVIILAAGKGTRMKSTLPKVLHSVCNKPIIHHILDTVATLMPAQTLLVTTKDLEKIFKDLTVDIVVQVAPQGTGDAVKTALPHISSDITHVLILCGDTSLITFDTLKNFIQSDSDLTVIGMKLDDHSLNLPYGRLVIEGPHLKNIVEVKDATDAEKKIPVANAGIYFGKKEIFRQALEKIANNNNAAEYYLTDIVNIAYTNGHPTSYVLGEMEEFLGVNNRVDLAHAEKMMQKRLRQYHMENGVTLIDPETVYFSACTKVGIDTIIYPNVYFGKNVIIDNNVTIYANCYLENCLLKDHSKVGPFAHLRANVTLHEKAEVGNFVELKNTTLGQSSKVKHLSYLGDTTVGAKTNIGAGTITCNYDGFLKHQTQIGDGVFIGSNTALIAPLTIEDNAMIGAGSTITENVEANSLAIARPKQTHKPDWTTNFRKKNQK